MKRMLIALAMTAILASASMAAENYLVKARVPFDFAVGNTEFSAGIYTIESQAVPATLLVRSAGGTAMRFIQAAPIYKNTGQDTATLVFNKYGDRYFLSKIIRPEGAGSQLNRGKVERELMASAPAETVIVAAVYR